MSQTLWMKSHIEVMRSHNSFGALIWQLGENWPTGGWGCIEYGPKRNLPGQIVGGRWKPLMYLLQRSLFRDVIVACGQDDLCYARNDGLSSASVLIWLEAWDLEKPQALRGISWYPYLGEGRSTAYFQLPSGFKNGADVILLHVRDRMIPHQPFFHTEVYLWESPQLLFAKVLSLPVTIHTTVRWNDDAKLITVELGSDRLALYVVLTTLAAGTFSDNAFVLWPGLRKVILFERLPGMDETIDIDLFRQSLRVEHLGGPVNVRAVEVSLR